MNLVSVIIPNYNHGQFLHQRIDSVLGQTYQNIEIIILDDATENNWAEIINSYARHSKVKHLLFNCINGNSDFFQTLTVFPFIMIAWPILTGMFF